MENIRRWEISQIIELFEDANVFSLITVVYCGLLIPRGGCCSSSGSYCYYKESNCLGFPLASQSVSQSVSQSAGRPASQPTSQPASHLASQSISQSVSRSVGQSVSRSVGQPVSQSVSQPATKYVTQSAVRQLPTQPASQPVSATPLDPKTESIQCVLEFGSVKEDEIISHCLSGHWSTNSTQMDANCGEPSRRQNYIPSWRHKYWISRERNMAVNYLSTFMW